MKTTRRCAVFLFLATSAWTLPAQAKDVPPVVAAIFKSWETQFKSEPTYEKLENDGAGNITITNLVANVAADGPTPGMKLTIGSIALGNVAEEANGLIDIGTATFSDTKVEISGGEGPPISVEMPRSSVEDWYVAVANDNPTPQQAFRESMSIAKKMSSGAIKFSVLEYVITADSYETTWDGDPVTGAGKFTLNVGNAIIPESAVAAMDPTGELKKLGYNELIVSAAGSGELTVGESSFGLNGNLEYAVRDMGSVKMAFGASDVPTATVVELRAAQKSGRPADLNALMPQLMNVTLGNFQLRFEDASITKKLLPIIAKKQGMEEAALVANAGAMMQIGLMQLKNQVFSDQVVGAVNAFLKDPKSFTLSFKPAAPVKVQQLMTLDPTNPGAAIDVLGVSVTAND